MAVFEYKAFDNRARKISGIIDAESMNAAQTQLRQKHIFPVSLMRISEREQGGKKTLASALPGFFIFSAISAGETAMITRQLATLLSAGFPLSRAVATLIGQTRTVAFKKVLSQVKDAIEEGSSFAEALALFPKVFSPVFINMVRAGESSGTLELVLERLADFAEKREDTRKKIRAALAYPVIMSVIGFGLLIFLLTYIVPRIIEIFADMNHTLPAPTLALIGISEFVKTFWWALLPLPLILFVLLLLIRKTKKGLLITDRIILFSPLIGPLIRKITAARFSRTLGSLLENGVPLLSALQITRAVAGNQVVSDLIHDAARHVEEGGALGNILSQSRAFPSLAGQMVMVGEASGELEKMLEKSAQLFERDVETAITAAMSLVEPIIILIMGAVVLFIILSITLPIFEINQMIG